MSGGVIIGKEFASQVWCPYAGGSKRREFCVSSLVGLCIGGIIWGKMVCKLILRVKKMQQECDFI